MALNFLPIIFSGNFVIQIVANQSWLALRKPLTRKACMFAKGIKLGIASALVAILCACAAPGGSKIDAQAPVGQASMPVFEAWFAGRRVLYLITDISDPAMARSMGSNLSTRMRDSLPPSPRPPSWRTVLEKIYVSEELAQAKIFASVPEPIGANSTDASYSPLWQVVKFRWVKASDKQVLRSEAEVLEAEAAGRVVLELTPIIINCPIVALDNQTLEGVRIWR